MRRRTFSSSRARRQSAKSCHISHLATLHKKAIVVDSPSMEGSNLRPLAIRLDWEASRIIEHLEPRLKEKGIVYKAQENMPRSRAKEASEAHGDVILPYIATLLYLAAWKGGAEGVRAFIAGKPTNMTCTDPKDAAAGELPTHSSRSANGLPFLHTVIGSWSRK